MNQGTKKSEEEIYMLRKDVGRLKPISPSI